MPTAQSSHTRPGQFLSSFSPGQVNFSFFPGRIKFFLLFSRPSYFSSSFFPGQVNFFLLFSRPGKFLQFFPARSNCHSNVTPFNPTNFTCFTVREAKEGLAGKIVICLQVNWFWKFDSVKRFPSFEKFSGP